MPTVMKHSRILSHSKRLVDIHVRFGIQLMPHGYNLLISIGLRI